MKFPVHKLCEKYNFFVEGVSYIGEPREGTAMFITNKVAHLLDNLAGMKHCLIFAELGIEPTKEMEQENCFIFSDCPSRQYAAWAQSLLQEERKDESQKKYTLTEDGYFLGQGVQLGKNVVIEPGCIIGHGVTIGDNSYIMAGAVIKHSSIGENVVVNEYAVIGAQGFTMTRDEQGNLQRMPTLGQVCIEDDVEIGAHDNVSRGSGGDTVIERGAKIDALVHIGHDAHIGANSEITAGGIIGGFVRAKTDTYTGINAVVRNRIELGEHCVVGMGATVTKSVAPNTTVIGNPARVYEKKKAK